MLNLPANIRVFLYRSPTDMRKSFCGLHGLVTETLKQDPLSGDFFVFMNRRRDRMKILVWEGDGFSIWYKRLESGTFRLPDANSPTIRLTSTELSLLLGGIDLVNTKRRRHYSKAV